MQLKEAKGVSTPCEDEKRWEQEDLSDALENKEARKYRELAARANYLAQDRADIQFATKEICRGMCSPCKAHWRKLKRLGRYLVSVPM